MNVTTIADLPVRIALTMGDPAGIGPEIIAKTLASWTDDPNIRLTILGDSELVRDALFRWGKPSLVHATWLSILDPQQDPRTSIEHLAEAAYIRSGVNGCLDGIYDAIVTAPICKEAMYARGFVYPGHTEYLAHLCGKSTAVMAFIAPRLRVSLATIHIPLATVTRHLTLQGLVQKILISAQGLKEFFAIPHPRLAVCGLNPHAGEGGHLGTEEQTLIRPAIQAAQAMGLDVRGPFPADTLFVSALNGRYDLILAMYHDQGLIPVKLLGFGAAVNVTLGLPLIRTSVDHGVAYDIAGQGMADASSMSSAISLAVDMARSRRSVMPPVGA